MNANLYAQDTPDLNAIHHLLSINDVEYWVKRHNQKQETG